MEEWAVSTRQLVQTQLAGGHTTQAMNMGPAMGTILAVPDPCSNPGPRCAVSPARDVEGRELGKAAIHLKFSCAGQADKDILDHLRLRPLSKKCSWLQQVVSATALQRKRRGIRLAGTSS